MEKEEITSLVTDILKRETDAYIKDQLKEHFQEAVSKIPIAPDPEVEKAKNEANKFKSGAEFLLAVAKARTKKEFDPRLQFVDSSGRVVKTTGHLEIGEDSQGGFLVPEIYRAQLLEIALEGAVVRPRATIIPMGTDSLKIPYVNDTSHASSVYGGVIAYWTAEAAQKTASKPTFGQLELTPHKLAGITYASNELLDDAAIALEPLIRRQFGLAWGYYEDDAFLQGTGAGQPLGIMNCGGTKTVLRNTVTRIHAEDIAEMYQSMLPSSLNKAIWVIAPSLVAELLELGSGNAADASGKILIWQPNFKEGIGNMTILGRPVIVSEKMQGLGTAGDILFADFSYYLIGDRQPITIDASTHLRFDYDETVWRFVLRVAGQCWPQSTLTTRRGSFTMSPFVVLSASTS